MFHYFNQPEYFEKWVTQTKREIFPPENKSHTKELDDLKMTIRKRQIQAMESDMQDKS